MGTDFLDKLNSFYAQPTPVQELVTALSIEKSVRIFVKRDDLIDPLVMGNKWRKLKYNLWAAYEQGLDTLLTFGGAYSNHILATAAAGAYFGFKTVGVIRGEELSVGSNEYLAKAASLGMRFHFIDRETYKLRTETSFWDKLRDVYGRIYILPEGGNNACALEGTSEMIAELPQRYDYYCCSCGTGNTAAGLAAQLPEKSQLLVLPALSQIQEQQTYIMAQAVFPNHVIFNTDYQFGGYAKHDAILSDFEAYFPIPLDKVYTAKLFYGVYDLLLKDYFEQGSSVLVYHSGGYSLSQD